MLSNLLLAVAVYTNLAGTVIAGAPAAINAHTVTLTNGAERAIYRLAIFPPVEQRRLAAAARSAILVPQRILIAVKGVEKAIARSRSRAERGEATLAQARAFERQERERLRNYLDREVKEGRLLSVERDLLEN